jgi:hypothetical protein
MDLFIFSLSAAVFSGFWDANYYTGELLKLSRNINSVFIIFMEIQTFSDQSSVALLLLLIIVAWHLNSRALVIEISSVHLKIRKIENFVIKCVELKG